MVSNEVKERFVELRAKGISYSSIADQLGVSKQSLITWSQELKNEIANLGAIERDAIYEKYRQDKISRIKMFGDELERVRLEFQKRDLSTIPTDKLFTLLLQLQTSLDGEVSPIRFFGKKTMDSDWSPFPDESWSA